MAKTVMSKNLKKPFRVTLITIMVMMTKLQRSLICILSESYYDIDFINLRGLSIKEIILYSSPLIKSKKTHIIIDYFRK